MLLQPSAVPGVMTVSFPPAVFHVQRWHYDAEDDGWYPRTLYLGDDWRAAYDIYEPAHATIGTRITFRGSDGFDWKKEMRICCECGEAKEHNYPDSPCDDCCTKIERQQRSLARHW